MTSHPRNRTRPEPHRNAAPRLDPYTVAEKALTLEEWRRGRRDAAPVHVVLPQAGDPRLVA